MTQDNLIMETEKEISGLIINYIKSRRNIVEITPINDIPKVVENISVNEETKINKKENNKNSQNDDQEKEESKIEIDEEGQEEGR